MPGGHTGVFLTGLKVRQVRGQKSERVLKEDVNRATH